MTVNRNPEQRACDQVDQLLESAGIITRFTNEFDQKKPPPEVFNFHRPKTLAQWHQEAKNLRSRLHDARSLKLDCQITDITGLEASFKQEKPSALVQIDKSFTANYRLLKEPASANRNLSLVDTKTREREPKFFSFSPIHFEKGPLNVS